MMGNLQFTKNSSRNTIRVSNSLDLFSQKKCEKITQQVKSKLEVIEYLYF